MAARGLYKATDGSWRQADANKGVPLLYRLKDGERWTLLDRDRAMVVHPTEPPKIVCPDGRVEEIGSDKTSVTTSASNVVTNIFQKQDGRGLILHHRARECLSS
jgi:hypothetical protein